MHSRRSPSAKLAELSTLKPLSSAKLMELITPTPPPSAKLVELQKNGQTTEGVLKDLKRRVRSEDVTLAARFGALQHLWHRRGPRRRWRR